MFGVQPLSQLAVNMYGLAFFFQLSLVLKKENI